MALAVLSNIDKGLGHLQTTAKSCGVRSKMGCRISCRFDLYSQLWLRKLRSSPEQTRLWTCLTQLTQLTQISRVLPGQNRMRGERAQESPSDRVQTQVCRVCRVAPQTVPQAHPVSLRPAHGKCCRRVFNFEVSYFEKAQCRVPKNSV